MLMVAPTSFKASVLFGPEVMAPVVPYSGYPWWSALLVMGNHERKSADFLERFAIHAYWPRFTRQEHRRGKLHKPKSCSVVPGIIFVPEEMLAISRRDEVFKYAHVYGLMKGTAGGIARFTKDQVEIVREIEAKLNLPPPVFHKTTYKIGQRVRFVNEVYAAFWGTGTIVEIASESRIGVEVDRLIGSAGKAYVPASEIEAM